MALIATRRMGEMLAEMAKTGQRKGKGQPPKETAHEETFLSPLIPPPTLKILGTERNEARRAQALAAIPEKKIDAYIAECRAKKKPVTQSGALSS